MVAVGDEDGGLTVHRRNDGGVLAVLTAWETYGLVVVVVAGTCWRCCCCWWCCVVGGTTHCSLCLYA